MGNNRGQHQSGQETQIQGLKELREFYGIDKKDIYDLYCQYIGVCGNNLMPLEEWIHNIIKTSKGEKVLCYFAVMGLNVMSMEVGPENKERSLLQ